MKYFEITKDHINFYNLNLGLILRYIKPYISGYTWSLQWIEGAGNVRDILGINMIELEKKCRSSTNGMIISFEKLNELSLVLDDLIDVLLVGCEDRKRIPRAYKVHNWEDMCDIIISREDSSIWQLYSKDTNISKIFSDLVDSKEEFYINNLLR